MEDEQQPENGSPGKLSFDEYKMFYETTEKVTERRIAANRWNYSVCIAVIVGISILVAWCSSRPTFFVFATVSVVVFCACGALFCAYWLREITSAKLLNGAKFAVLNDMAKAVDFGRDDLVSYEPFAKEWDLVVASEGALPVGGLQGRLALRSSGAELFTPRVFGAVFVVVGLGAVVSAIVAITVPIARPYLPLSPSGAHTAQTSPAMTPPPTVAPSP